MKNILLTTAVLGSLTFVGCSSAYRSAQTPDDVYYSEGPPRADVAHNETKSQPDGYTSYWERQDDNMLRMKVNDRNKWNAVDDIDYWQGYNNNYWVNYNNMYNNPYTWNKYGSWANPYYNNWGWNPGWSVGFGSGFGWNNWGIGYNAWNRNWSNPSCWSKPVTVINKFPVGGRTAGSLNGYSNYTYNRSASGLNKGGNSGITPGTSRSIWETNSVPSTRSSGNSLFRTITRPSSGYDGGSSSYDRPSRSFDSGGSSGGTRSSGGGSGSSSGGSSGSSSRGGRGG